MDTSPDNRAAVRGTAMGILVMLSLSHMINDTLQALLPAIYPMLKGSFNLTFAQIGLITLSYQLTASILQPLIGAYTDKHPMPYSLACGMGVTLVGLACLSQAGSYPMILASSMVIGMGSAIFHPEASRTAHMAAGDRHGFAQSLFQVGGNFGTSLGPLLAALIIVRRGQGSILWFTILALCGITLLSRVGGWSRRTLPGFKKRAAVHARQTLSRRTVVLAMMVLITLVFSKYFYLVSITNYYTFYLIQKFGLSITGAQYCLFAFLAAVAAGTIIGGPLGDRFGRKYVIWVSILGVAPFSLALPHFGLVGTIVLSVVIGAILASAFSAILVFAQELIPGKVGMVSGLFFGIAFGFGGIASAALGKLADMTSIGFLFEVCGYLPLIGILTWFLPDIEGSSQRARRLETEALEVGGNP